MPKLPFALPALALLAGFLLSACASEPAPRAPVAAPEPTGSLRDSSRHWEKNYQLSDYFNNRFNLYAADIRRLIARLNQGDVEALPMLRGRGLSVEAINGLARFAEELTRMPLL